jgi:hypothetical protein
METATASANGTKAHERVLVNAVTQELGQRDDDKFFMMLIEGTVFPMWEKELSTV